MPNEAGGIPVVANPFAPDVLADDAIGFEAINNTIRITFAAVKMVEPVPPSPVQLVTVGRLVTTIEGAQRLALNLFNYLKEQGHDPRALVGSGEMKH